MPAPLPDASAPCPSRTVHALQAALPLACLAAVFLLELAHGVFVRADAFQAYSMFSTTLGNLLAAREFPQWLPLAAYGSPAEPYMLTFLGPLHLLVLLAGAALNLTDAWTLFLLATFAESAVLVLGSQLLARDLYKSGWTAAAVACWVAVSVYWCTQIFWAHRVLVYVPLMLLFALRLHRTGDPRQLLRCALAALLALPGGLAYMAPMYALLGCVLLVALRVFDRASGAPLRLERPGPALMAELALVAGFGALYFLLLGGAFEGLGFASPDRDAATGAASLDVFLRYGGSALHTLPELVTGTWRAHIEYLFYLGAPGVGLLAYALWRERSGAFLALGVLSAVVLLLALGPHGGIGYAAYWFPGMNRFRHLSFLLPVLRLLLFFLAGYGLDRLLGADRDERQRAFACLMLAGVVILALKRVPPFSITAPGLGRYAPEFGVTLLLIARLGVGLAGRMATARQQALGLALGLGVALAALLDLGWAQHFLLRDTYSHFSKAEVRDVGGVDATRARPPLFFAARPANLEGNPNAQAMVAFALRQPVNNFTLLQMAGADPAAPLFRIDYATAGVLALLERAAPGALGLSNGQRDPQLFLHAYHWREALAKDWFRQAVGCTAKLTVEGADGSRRDASGEITHFSANRLALAVDAGGAGGALYYADAFHPGWRALVDGRPTPVVLAREAFKAVPLAPGRHLVELSFFDPGREWARRGLALLGAMGLAHLLACALARSVPNRAEAERKTPIRA